MAGMVFSSVRLERAALECSLDGIARMRFPNEHVQCVFYDDNVENDSSVLLGEYARKHGWHVLRPMENLPESQHSRLSNDRGWTASTVERVTRIKNYALELANLRQCDWIFLMDCDLVAHSELVAELVGSGCEIISGVFWTRFKQQDPLLPNCWDIQTYRFDSVESILRLKTPGLYEVGGLGAATLIRRSALMKGVTFSKIRNLDMWGEDKHFCVRAVCLGVRLFVSTKYPLFHMYRPGDVPDGRRFLESGCPPEEIQRLLDTEWECEVRSWFGKGQGERKGSVRDIIASGLRRVARFIESR